MSPRAAKTARSTSVCHILPAFNTVYSIRYTVAILVLILVSRLGKKLRSTSLAVSLEPLPPNSLLRRSTESAQSTTGTNFSGPKSGDYSITDSLPLTSVVWSPCGSSSALNINSQVRLSTSSTTATGQITDDSVDGKITFQFGFNWQTC